MKVYFLLLILFLIIGCTQIPPKKYENNTTILGNQTNTTISDQNTSISNQMKLSRGSKICPDGSNISLGILCKDNSIMLECADGTRTYDPELCKPLNIKVCPDGSIINDSLCKAFSANINNMGNVSSELNETAALSTAISFMEKSIHEKTAARASLNLISRNTTLKQSAWEVEVLGVYDKCSPVRTFGMETCAKDNLARGKFLIDKKTGVILGDFDRKNISLQNMKYCPSDWETRVVKGTTCKEVASLLTCPDGKITTDPELCEPMNIRICPGGSVINDSLCPPYSKQALVTPDNYTSVLLVENKNNYAKVGGQINLTLKIKPDEKVYLDGYLDPKNPHGKYVWLELIGNDTYMVNFSNTYKYPQEAAYDVLKDVQNGQILVAHYPVTLINETDENLAYHIALEFMAKELQDKMPMYSAITEVAKSITSWNDTWEVKITAIYEGCQPSDTSGFHPVCTEDNVAWGRFLIDKKTGIIVG